MQEPQSRAHSSRIKIRKIEQIVPRTVCANVAIIFGDTGGKLVPRSPQLHRTTSAFEWELNIDVFQVVQAKPSYPISKVVHNLTQRGLLEEWEVCRERRRYQQHTFQFSAVRALDFPSKSITVVDEIESFLHVLVYCAVQSLQHNIPDDHVGLFLHKYFEEPSAGMSEIGDLAAPTYKRYSMFVGGPIRLEFFGILEAVRFTCAYSLKSSPATTTRIFHPQPTHNHPINGLINTLLSWLSARYALDHLKAEIVPDASQPGLGGRVPLLDSDDEDEAEGSTDQSSFRSSSPFNDVEHLHALSAKLDDHSKVLKLFRETRRNLKRFLRYDKGGTRTPRGDPFPDTNAGKRIHTNANEEQKRSHSGSLTAEARVTGSDARVTDPSCAKRSREDDNAATDGVATKRNKR
ncbi:hypothetical protein GSI_04051 [Ganoderma sinense ZZ0214-1]|uniref:Fungal-type protein kinase domain-containing protein n=1 Tax=Ganoderma sinense ZZ0214-1 TaxID=1077348 RepID=A0A2G8SI32_9APHY|nr:hypothetical protein GSI_04051 [Ganoderma sinense ZZ0214-1]